MLNREERRGILWIGMFMLILVALITMFIVLSDPSSNPPSVVEVQSTPLKLGSVRGQVLNKLNGQPVEGQFDVLGLQGVSDHWQDESDPQRPGWFQINGLPAGTRFRLSVTALDFETVVEALEVEAGRTLNLGVLELRPLVPLRGTTTDMAGNPLTDVVVRARRRGEKAEEAHSDGDGRFVFPALIADHYEVHAHRAAAGPCGWRMPTPRTVDLTLGPPEMRDEQLELGPTVRVEVTVPADETVRFDGRILPAKDQPLVLEVNRQPFELQLLSARGLVTEFLVHPDTDEIDLGFLETAAVTLDCSAVLARPSLIGLQSTGSNASGNVTWTSTVGTRIQDHSHALPVRLGRTLELRLLTADGYSQQLWLESTSLALAPVRAGALREIPIHTELSMFPGSSRESSACFPHLRQPMRLAGSASFDVEVAPEGRTTTPSLKRLTELAEPGTTPLVQRGVVLDAQGSPLFHARVELFRSAGGALLSSTWSFQDGTFELPWPAPRSELLEPLQLVVRSTAAGIYHRTLLERSEDLEVQLPEAGFLRLRFLGENGTPLAGCVVTLDAGEPWQELAMSRTSGLGALQRITNTDGAVLFRNLPPGRYELASIQYRGEVPSRPLVLDLEEGAILEPEPVWCHRPHRFLARILDSDSRPISGAAMEVISQQDGFQEIRHQSTSSQEGQILFVSLPPPPWTATIRAEGFEPLLVQQLQAGTTLPPLIQVEQPEEAE